MWIGTSGRDLVKFDGINWTIYNTSNSGLSLNDGIQSIAIDTNGDKWIGTYNEGLARFDGTNWTVYDTSNSDMPHYRVRSIVIDDNGNKWMASGSVGLIKFDGTNWFVYNKSNSSLPHNNVYAIAIDHNNSKWIGTVRCLAVYNEDGITLSIDENISNKKTIPKDYQLSQNYPNPFNPSTTIKFTLPKSGYVELIVYNILGKKVTTLVSNKLNQGNHTYRFDGTNLASGIYYYEIEAGDFQDVKKMILLR